MAASYEPAREVGGDFFDAFALPQRPDRQALVIGDVTGKGVAAALMMAFSRAVLRSAAYNSRGPADALRRANHVLATDVRIGLFLTALAVEIEENTGRLRWSCAGHEPPYLFRARSGTLRELDDTAPLIGMVAKLPTKDRRLTMHPGDRLVLWTDGVTDARSPQGETFGEPRFRQALLDVGAAGEPQSVVEHVMASLEAWVGGGEAADDITLVVIERV